MKKLSLALGALLAIAPGCRDAADHVGDTAELKRRHCDALLSRFDGIQIPPEGDISCADSAAALVEKQCLADQMRYQECPLIDFDTIQKAVTFFRGKLITLRCISGR